MRLHGTRRVILMLHSDCGAYGGLAEDSVATPQPKPRITNANCKRAAANLRAAIPGVEVQGYFVDFDGIWDAEINAEVSTAEPAQVATVA